LENRKTLFSCHYFYGTLHGASFSTARMTTPIDSHKDEIAALCREHSVRRLHLFGSAANGKFDVDRSDLDFLVEFDDLSPDRYANSYFALQDALQELLGRHVDLITENNMVNPYFRSRVLAESQSVYAR
jgi:predicted nucleotidyltransferase